MPSALHSRAAGSEAQSSSAALAAAAATAQAAAAAPGAQLGQAAGMGGPEDLPFELRVLEAALDTVSGCRWAAMAAA